MQGTVFEAPEEVDERHGDLPGANIGLWLARHGVRVEVSRAADAQADLTVAGGYGASARSRPAA